MPPDPPLPAALCKARLEAGAERWQRTVRDARTETDRHKDEKEIAADVDEASEDETHGKFDGSEVCEASKCARQAGVAPRHLTTVNKRILSANKLFFFFVN